MLMKAITVDAQAVQRHRATILECVKVLHSHVYILENKYSTTTSVLRGRPWNHILILSFFATEFCFWKNFILAHRILWFWASDRHAETVVKCFNDHAETPMLIV